MKRTLFNADEIAPAGDYNAPGQHMLEIGQNIVGGGMAWPHHYARVTVSEQAATTARINPGQLWIADKVYDLDAPADVNLLPRLPLVVGDTVWIALLLRGAVVTDTAQRQVLIDVDTEATDLQTVPKTERHTVTVVEQAGIPGPTPLKPTVASNECVVAWVLLSSTGIELIEMNIPHRVKTVYEIEGRLTIVEGQVADLYQRTASIQTDLANLSSSVRNVPRPEIIEQLQRQAAAERRALGILELDPFASFYDPGLVIDAWDPAHVDWLARVKEGIRFSYANQRDSQLALLDPAQATIRVQNNVLMPAWTETPRIVVEGNDGSKDVSQLVHTTITAIRREVSRSSVSYGPTIEVCENRAEWSGLQGKRVGDTFQAAGETFQAVGLTDHPNNSIPEFMGEHAVFAVQQLITSSWTETYWDYVTTMVGLNGSVYGSTFLLSQPMIATSVDLFFTRRGSTGDVHLVLCECDPSGAPAIERAIVSATVTAASLSDGWNKFSFRPSYLQPGRRYAWFIATVGNHALAFVTGNKFAQGSLFLLTDGAWAQGSTTEDFAFRLNGANFASTRTVVEFDAATLENGMTEIHMLYEGWEPAGTSLAWEFRPSGTTEWLPMRPMEGSPLVGLPALTRIRAVFVGTTDLMPALLLSNKARVVTARHRTTMVAVSDEQAFGVATTSIVAEMTVDAFNPALHTAALTLITGGTVRTASTTTVTVDPYNSRKRKIRSTFTVPSTSAARLRPTMSTSNVVAVPFIQDIAMYAI